MAARKSTPHDDGDALDLVEAADVDDDESASEDDLSDAEVDPEEVDVDAEDDDLDDGAETLREVPDGFVTDDEPDDDSEAPVVPLAVFDDDDDEAIARVATDEDDDEDVDGLRDGEFVCRSCFMAKRESALADAKRLLCRDCA